MKNMNVADGINGKYIDYIFIEEEDMTLDEAIEEFGDEDDVPEWMKEDHN